MTEEVKVVEVERKSWYNDAEGFDKWRVFPRILITLYGVMFYKTCSWFMTLPDPTNSQSAFVSVIVKKFIVKTDRFVGWLTCFFIIAGVIRHW